MLTALILSQAVLLAQAGQQDPFAQYKVDLVPIGKKAPNFTVKNETGADFDLYKSMKKETKATLVNFWFST